MLQTDSLRKIKFCNITDTQYDQIRFINLQDIMKLTFLIILLLVAVQNLKARHQYHDLASKKGMTWALLKLPKFQNNWVAHFGCDGCNPYNGDTDCETQLPILCLISPKSIPRPYYDYGPITRTGSAYSDNGFYNGWTGGVFAVTKPYKGTALTNKVTADQLCQKQFGPTASIMQHGAWYMPMMNQDPQKVWATWNWSAASGSGWSAWGYSTGINKGRYWAWINNQRNGNCGTI